MTPNNQSTILAAAAIGSASLSQPLYETKLEDVLVLKKMNTLATSNLSLPMELFRPTSPRPDQINWPKSQRKNRKNKRRLFAAGGRVDFKK